MTKYQSCKSFDLLRDKLRDAGCNMHCAAQYPADDNGHWETWRILPPVGAMQVVVFRLMGADGYQMFRAVETNSIAADVADICERAL